MARAVSGGAKKRGRKKKTSAEPSSRGLRARQLTQTTLPAEVTALLAAIEQDDGQPLATYRDPLGGHWHVLAALPIERVSPTPYQRDLSPAHVERLAQVIDRMDRFVDPVVAVRAAPGSYFVPNGNHRLAALRSLGAKAIVALVLADEEVAYQILALNTEKAHNVREKSLEVIRMARALAELDPRPEKEFAREFEEPAFVTLGACYEMRGRFSGGVYHPVLRRIDAFQTLALPAALAVRQDRATRLLALDDEVARRVAELKARGLASPYLKAFVVARINPLRFSRRSQADFDETIAQMLKASLSFDAGKIRVDQVATAYGPPED